jgi:hypothetical protein
MVATTTRARTAARLRAKAEKAAAADPMPTRTQRTAEQRIADLEAQIEQVKRRAAAKKVKKDPALRHVSGALRSIDKALASSEDKPTREALSEARTGLAAILTLSGAMVPAGRGRAKPRGVGPVIEEDALLAYIQAHPGSRSEDIAVALGTDTAGIRPALVGLKQAGRVVVGGKARATRYSVTS